MPTMPGMVAMTTILISDATQTVAAMLRAFIA